MRDRCSVPGRLPQLAARLPRRPPALEARALRHRSRCFEEQLLRPDGNGGRWHKNDQLRRLPHAVRQAVGGQESSTRDSHRPRQLSGRSQRHGRHGLDPAPLRPARLDRAASRLGQSAPRVQLVLHTARQCQRAAGCDHQHHHRPGTTEEPPGQQHRIGCLPECRVLARLGQTAVTRDEVARGRHGPRGRLAHARQDEHSGLSSDGRPRRPRSLHADQTVPRRPGVSVVEAGRV